MVILRYHMAIQPLMPGPGFVYLYAKHRWASAVKFSNIVHLSAIHSVIYNRQFQTVHTKLSTRIRECNSRVLTFNRDRNNGSLHRGKMCSVIHFVHAYNRG